MASAINFHGSFRFRWPWETHFHGSFRFRRPLVTNFHRTFRFRWLPETHFQAELPEDCIFQNGAPVLSELTGAHHASGDPLPQGLSI